MPPLKGSTSSRATDSIPASGREHLMRACKRLPKTPEHNSKLKLSKKAPNKKIKTPLFAQAEPPGERRTTAVEARKFKKQQKQKTVTKKEKILIREYNEFKRFVEQEYAELKRRIEIIITCGNTLQTTIQLALSAFKRMATTVGVPPNRNLDEDGRLSPIIPRDLPYYYQLSAAIKEENIWLALHRLKDKASIWTIKLQTRLNKWDSFYKMFLNKYFNGENSVTYFANNKDTSSELFHSTHIHLIRCLRSFEKETECVNIITEKINSIMIRSYFKPVCTVNEICLFANQLDGFLSLKYTGDNPELLVPYELDEIEDSEGSFKCLFCDEYHRKSPNA